MAAAKILAFVVPPNCFNTAIDGYHLECSTFAPEDCSVKNVFPHDVDLRNVDEVMLRDALPTMIVLTMRDGSGVALHETTPEDAKITAAKLRETIEEVQQSTGK